MVHRRRGDAAQEREVTPHVVASSRFAADKRRSSPIGFRCGALFFCASLILGCGGGRAGDPDDSPGDLVIGVPESTQEDADRGLQHLIEQIGTETLTDSGNDGRALPRLAQSWSWENDDLRLRLKLRDDVLLHDGRRFDSQLAAEALAIAMSRPTNRAGYPALRDITAARPDGPFDLVLDLARRSALLPEDLTVLVDIPAGPDRVVGRSDRGTELERFEQFYLGTPTIERVVLRPIDTLRTAWASLLRGELDFVTDVPAEAVEFVAGNDVHIIPVKRHYQWAIAFNSRSGPLRVPEVRRALNLAVDRETLVRELLQGAGSPASTPIWPDYWAAERTAESYEFDPEQAAALLDAAGFPLQPASGGRPAARFTLTCLIPAEFSVVERMALQVQRDLFDVGVDLRFRATSVDEFGKLIAMGEFEAVFLDIVSGPTPGRTYIFWGSAQRFQGVYNVFGYENAEAERLFDVLRTTRNEAAVRSATRRLHDVMLEDPPALFLAWNMRARAIRSEFAVRTDEGTDPVFSLWRWAPRSDTLTASAP